MKTKDIRHKPDDIIKTSKIILRNTNKASQEKQQEIKMNHKQALRQH